VPALLLERFVGYTDEQTFARALPQQLRDKVVLEGDKRTGSTAPQDINPLMWFRMHCRYANKFPKAPVGELGKEYSTCFSSSDLAAMFTFRNRQFLGPDEKKQGADSVLARLRRVEEDRRTGASPPKRLQHEAGEAQTW
jgi:hypothetical protein